MPPPAVTNNPSPRVDTPPPQQTPPPASSDAAAKADAASADAARPLAHESAPPPANLGNPADAATVMKGWQNVGVAEQQAQATLIATEVNATAVETFQSDNQTGRADTSDGLIQNRDTEQRTLTNNSEFQSYRSTGDLRDQGFKNMSFAEAQRAYHDFLSQGSMLPNPNRPNLARGSQEQVPTGEELLHQPQTFAGRSEGRPNSRGLAGQNPGAERAPTFRPHTLGFLVPERGRQVAHIFTRDPSAGHTGPLHEGEAPPEGNPESHANADSAAAGSQLASMRGQRPAGEKRLAADRAKEEGREEGSEGSTEGESAVARSGGDPALQRVVAQYQSGQGGGQQDQEREASVTETLERHTIQFGESEPSASTVNAAEHSVLGVTVAGGGTYVRRVAARQGEGGRQDAPWGNPEDRMMASAQGVHAGPAHDMGQLYPDAVCVHVEGRGSEMINMASAEGRARLDAICSTHPEVRSAVNDLVQQRHNFTTHVTANLFNINGGEPSARA